MNTIVKLIITPLSRETIARIVITSLMLMIACTLQAQNVGDFTINEKVASTGRVTLRSWPKGPNTLWGTDANGFPQRIIIGAGLSLGSGSLIATAPSTVSWSSVTAKPTTLAGYGIADSLTATAAAAAYAPLSHTQAISTVTGLQAALDAKAASSHTQAWSTITSTPTTLAGYGIADSLTAAAAAAAYAPLSHTQAISTVTGLQAALDGKAAAGGVSLQVIDTHLPNLLGYYSVARKRVPWYQGPLIRVLNTTSNAQTNIPQTAAGLLDETALMAARATGDKLVLVTVFDQSGVAGDLTSIDTTKALVIVTAAGAIQRLGRLPCGIAEADSHGCYKTANFTAYTGTQASGFWVGSFARSPGIMGTYAYGVANGTAALWGSDAAAVMLYRVDQTVNAIAYRNLVPNVIPGGRSFWEDERVTVVTRFTGSQSISDLGYAPGVSSSTATFNFNNLVVGGVNNATNTMAINTRFAELAVWRADIGAVAGRALQSDAAGAYAVQSSKFNGKKIVWVGTSMPVTVTDDTNRSPYPQRLAEAIGAWIVNQGTGSSRLTYSASYSLTLTATRAEQVANGFSSAVNESFETKVLGGVGNVDFLVIDHGLNDHGQTMGSVTSTAKTEYCGALNFLRTQTLRAHPSCRFIALTPITSRAFGNSVATQINTVAASMRAWAAQYSDVTVIDPLADLAWGAAEVTAYCPDGTHLNAAGAAVVAAYLTGKFNAF